MAAGPVEISRQFKEELGEITEKLNSFNEGLSFASGLGLLEFDEWCEIDETVKSMERDVEYLENVLDKISNKYPDKTVEEIRKERNEKRKEEAI